MQQHLHHHHHQHAQHHYHHPHHPSTYAQLLHQHFQCTNNLNECNCDNCTMLKEYAAGIGLSTSPSGLGPDAAPSGASDDINEPKATYSYLKSYFVSMLQPSDNKLAMKLFGSKKGVLKEKLRQQEVGHWIIHPCSNFRYIYVSYYVHSRKFYKNPLISHIYLKS